ncbi:MAG TPA: 2-hydroxyglutaryl-CoA dehydratase [Myxococcota bacterium]|nr:2-hydroxyglutaryl-CoA dehydratase [Myxococcota bacterium]
MNENDIEIELAEFARTEAERLGLGTEQYTERIDRDFRASQRHHTTLLVSGLTLAHDRLNAAALRGIGYRAEMLDCPDTEALQLGREFGNRGQCNPTYFTVGNLIKQLTALRAGGLSTEQIVSDYVFLTAGACGPCRFGTYITEYRKALRDSGFEGFRVLLVQQQGGIQQATGEDLGLQLDLRFSYAILRALVASDVLNLQGYRMRPYELVPGSTDAALESCKDVLEAALSTGGSVLAALLRCRRILARVPVDRSQPKPLVSVIGEFWAMTTEGDGNYRLQRFLEEQGAEVHVQSITNWLLFMLWENRFDTLERMELRRDDGSRKGLEGKDPTKKLWGLAIGERAIRLSFQIFAKAIGLYGHTLPDMDEIATLAAKHYGNDVRGGEAHMEVGKVIHFAEHGLNHMTLSVKPFGCMPSSGVSDGVQSLVTARWPEAIFLPVETTGDGEVGVQSRIQMRLFSARQRCRAEFEQALEDCGLDEQTFRQRVAGSRRWSGPFHRPPHRVAGGAANLVFAVR